MTKRLRVLVVDDSPTVRTRAECWHGWRRYCGERAGRPDHRRE
jgi:hypothetical protein